MTKLSWGDPSDRLYESGIDLGVLFVNNGPGVAWNGLISVDEKLDGGDVNSYYIDGKRYLNIANSTDFAATITAFSNPSEFDSCIGIKGISTGLYITNQRPSRFDLAYRTILGDGHSSGIGYKIHLVYSALAKPSDVSYSTQTSTVEPLNKSYDVATVPQKISGQRPTAHLIIDSRNTNPFTLDALENFIYGTDDLDPRMPSVADVINLYNTIPE